MLSPEFLPFVQGAPCAVMTRLAAEWLLDEATVNELFDAHAVEQYQREITLSNVVNVMLDVACGTRRSPRAAFMARSEEIAASLSAFYGKLQRTETSLGEAIIAHTAKRARELIRKLGGEAEEPVPGYRSVILDGNMLAGTEHRLEPLRKSRAAALPGKALALYECATGLILHAILEEDAYSQERALLPAVTLSKGMHLIADRNFCVPGFLAKVQASKAFFTVRQHRSSLPLESLEILEEKQCIGETSTGQVYEQQVQVTQKEEVYTWRMVTLELHAPTRGGDQQIVLFSNLPSQVSGLAICEAYRQRWTIENHFQRLTEWLHCEVETLSHPRAALFAFSMSVVAGNLLAIVIASLRAVHGNDLADNVSYCELADEAGGAYRGMLMALPPARWEWASQSSVSQMATLLKRVAEKANPKRLRKTTRKPKPPQRTPNCTNIRHRSTHRVINNQKTKKKPS